jgi:hypothetical protein
MRQFLSLAQFLSLVRGRQCCSGLVPWERPCDLKKTLNSFVTPSRHTEVGCVQRHGLVEAMTSLVRLATAAFNDLHRFARLRRLPPHSAASCAPAKLSNKVLPARNEAAILVPETLGRGGRVSVARDFAKN